MNHDINVKKMRLNCFRQSKVPGEFMLQMRVPGGIFWHETEYRSNFNVKPVAMHHKAGPQA